MTISEIILAIMMGFMAIGAVDYLVGGRLTGNRVIKEQLNLGKQFTEGFAAFGSIALTMAGVLVLTPLLGKVIGPLVTPLCQAVGIDPAIFAGIFLANDMGGYPLAEELALTPEAIGLGGMILSSMMGVNIVFNIPVALSIIDKEDRPAMSRGILCGFITVPIGCFVGGLVAGYPVGWLLLNLLPVLIISVIIALLLILVPNGITKVFIIFGRIIGILSAIAAVIAIASGVLNITLLPGLGSIYDAMDVVVAVVLILPGAYVMVTVISKLLRKPFAAAGKLLGINDKATLGLVSTLANCVPTFGLMKDMDQRGKVVNFAFLTSAGFLLGDHLAFCSAMNASLVLPMLAGKLTGGVCAVICALLLTKKGKN